METKKERKIAVPINEYREYRRAMKRQTKAKRLVIEMWQLYKQVN